MKNSLRKKILLSVIIPILIFGVIATTSVFFYVRGIIFDIQEENLKSLSIEQSREIDNLLSNISSLSATLARQTDVVNYFLNEDRLSNEAGILKILKSYNVNNSFSAIYIIDADGMTWASTDPSFVGKNYRFRDYFENAMRGEQSAEVALGVTSKKLGYYFSSPIFDYSGNIIGATVFKADPELVNKSLDRFSDVESSNVMLVDKFGVVVYASLKNRLYNTLDDLSAEEQVYIYKERTYEDVEFKSLGLSEARNSIATLGANSSAVMQLYDKKDRAEEIFSISRVGEFPFFLIVEEGLGKYVSVTINTGFLVSSMVFLAAFFALVFIYIIVNRILKPLKKLSEANSEIQAGNYGFKSDIKTGDELEDLSESFNKMSQNLQSNVASIEKEVEDRTKKLSKINKMMIGREKRIAELKEELKKSKSK